MSAAPDLDRTIVRPALFRETGPAVPLKVVARLRPDTRLPRIRRAEVAEVVADHLAQRRHINERPSIGHE